MRKIIYAIGSIFLVVGIIILLFAGRSFFVDDPYNLSKSEFLEIYNNRQAYSYAYYNIKNDVIFICLDMNANKNDDKRIPLCKGHRRYVEVSKLDKALVEEILK